MKRMLYWTKTKFLGVGEGQLHEVYLKCEGRSMPPHCGLDALMEKVE